MLNTTLFDLTNIQDGTATLIDTNGARHLVLARPSFTHFSVMLITAEGGTHVGDYLVWSAQMSKLHLFDSNDNCSISLELDHISVLEN